MADLIAFGYPDESTAARAAKEVERLAGDLIIQPDAVAVIVRDQEGKFHVTTNHNPVAAGATWGLFWGFLFGVLFFVPLLGIAIGAGLGAVMGAISKLDMDKEFQDRVRDLLQPGTSALFMVVEKMTTDRAVGALGEFGGTVLKTSLSEDAERELQQALHGRTAAAA
jgi:uncharacterized membrane protein